MEPDWKNKNDPADTSLKEDLSIDTTFDPSWFSWDTPFMTCHSTTHMWKDYFDGFLTSEVESLAFSS